MVNRETGNDDIERFQRWQRLFQIMVQDLNSRISLEPGTRGGQHRGGKIERNADGSRPFQPNQCEQSAIAGAEVENTARRRGCQFQQNRLAFGAMRNAVRSR